MADSTSTNACARALSTVELLENVLIHLSSTDVVRSRRVSRRWQATIAASPSLRQHIFLDPKPTTHLVTISKKGVSAEYLADIYEDDDDEDIERMTLSLHPLLVDHAKEDRDREPTTCEFGVPIGKLARLRGGEWRQMFVTNPPAIEIDVDDWTMRRKHGITLGELYDTIVAVHHGPGRIRKRWVEECEIFDFISEDSQWLKGAKFERVSREEVDWFSKYGCMPSCDGN